MLQSLTCLTYLASVRTSFDLTPILIYKLVTLYGKAHASILDLSNLPCSSFGDINGEGACFYLPSVFLTLLLYLTFGNQLLSYSNRYLQPGGIEEEGACFCLAPINTPQIKVLILQYFMKFVFCPPLWGVTKVFK